jgi:hypothetical protein
MGSANEIRHLTAWYREEMSAVPGLCWERRRDLSHAERHADETAAEALRLLSAYRSSCRWSATRLRLKWAGDRCTNG